SPLSGLKQDAQTTLIPRPNKSNPQTLQKRQAHDQEDRAPSISTSLPQTTAQIQPDQPPETNPTPSTPAPRQPNDHHSTNTPRISPATPAAYRRPAPCEPKKNIRPTPTRVKSPACRVRPGWPAQAGTVGDGSI